MSRKTPLLLSSLGVALLLLGLAGWWYRTSHARSGTPSPLRIGLNIWPGYGAFLIAQHEHFFEQEGAAVDIQIIQGDSERDAALVAGRLDGIGMTLDNLALLRARGINVKAIFKYDDSFGADGIVARNEITTLQQLKHRSVAWALGTPSHFFLVQALKPLGLTTKDLRHTAMAPDDAGAAFAAGKLDGAVTWEPWLTKAQSSGRGHVLLSTRQLPVIHDVLFLNSDRLTHDREEVLAFLRACFHAIQYWQDHRDAGDTIIAQRFNLPLQDVKDMLRGIRILDLSDNATFFGTTSRPGPAFPAYQEAVNTWLGEGIITQPSASADAIDPSFIAILSKH